MLDRLGRQAELAELAMGDDPMLAPGQLPYRLWNG
jgi:hypothetical protein